MSLYILVEKKVSLINRITNNILMDSKAKMLAIGFRYIDIFGNKYIFDIFYVLYISFCKRIS